MAKNNDFLQEIEQTFLNHEEYKISKFKKDKLDISLLFIQGMTDLQYFIGYLYPFLDIKTYKSLNNYIPSLCSPLTIETIDNISYLLGIGHLILAIQYEDELVFYHFPLASIPKRSPSESSLDPSNLFQAKDGLIEDARDNILLLKKRIKTNSLVIEKYLLGEKTMTDVFMLYLDEYKKTTYVKEIGEKLTFYKDQGSCGINSITKLFEENSLVPLTLASGATEYLAENLLKGKVVIIVDGNPIAIILPALFLNFTTSKDELDAPKFYSLTKRIFVMICLFLAVFFLGFYVAIMNYHSNLLSLKVIASIKITERGTIIPMFLEILLVLFFFEIYNLSTSRSPLGYIQNIIVLFGGIFIGQNAVSSGFIGPFILLLTSLCYICGYSVSNNPRFVTCLSFFRLFILFGSVTFGLIGFLITSLLVVYYLYNKKSVGIPYLSPFAPGNPRKALHYYYPES